MAPSLESRERKKNAALKASFAGDEFSAHKSNCRIESKKKIKLSISSALLMLATTSVCAGKTIQSKTTIHENVSEYSRKSWRSSLNSRKALVAYSSTFTK